MRIAQLMAGAPAGGAELFFERLSIALAAAGDTVLPLIRHNPARVKRLQAAGLAPQTFSFGSVVDIPTRWSLGTALRAFAPRIAVAWMGRAATLAPSGDWVLAGRLGGYYDLSRFRRCDHLIGNTRTLAAWIAAQGWPAARTHHLPNFAPDLAGAAPAPLPSPLILALGRLHPNKAFDTLIRAMPHLPGAHLAIAGDGPLRPALERLARIAPGRVHFLGWRADTAALLAAATVLACTSRHEPLGNVVIEAWSAGTPVIATAADGPRELITPGADGLLVPIDHPRALADALAGLLADPARAAALAAAGRARYEADFAEAPVLAAWRRTLATLEKP